MSITNQEVFSQIHREVIKQTRDRVSISQDHDRTTKKFVLPNGEMMVVKIEHKNGDHPKVEIDQPFSFDRSRNVPERYNSLASSLADFVNEGNKNGWKREGTGNGNKEKVG